MERVKEQHLHWEARSLPGDGSDGGGRCECGRGVSEKERGFLCKASPGRRLAAGKSNDGNGTQWNQCLMSLHLHRGPSPPQHPGSEPIHWQEDGDPSWQSERPQLDVCAAWTSLQTLIYRLCLTRSSDEQQLTDTLPLVLTLIHVFSRLDGFMWWLLDKLVFISHHENNQ